MRQYKSFSSEKVKINQLWQQNADNERIILDQLGPLKIITFDKTFIKTITKLTLREQADGSVGQEWSGSYALQNFPDWVINFIRPVAFFSLNDEGRHTLLRGGKDISEVTIEPDSFQFQYWFQKLAPNQYIFRFSADISLDNEVIIGESSEFFDYFLTVHLYIYNYNLFDDYQKRKT